MLLTSGRQKGQQMAALDHQMEVNVELEKPEGILESHRGSLLFPGETVLTFALVLKNPEDWISFSTSALQLSDQKKDKTWVVSCTNSAHACFIHSPLYSTEL